VKEKIINKQIPCTKKINIKVRGKSKGNGAKYYLRRVKKIVNQITAKIGRGEIIKT